MKLFVRNIPWSASEKDLHDFLTFNGYAGVGVKIVIDKDTKQSRGFGFLTFQTDLQGEKALAELDGVDFMGRALQVLPSTSPDRPSHASRAASPVPPPVVTPSVPELDRQTPPKPPGKSGKSGKGDTGFAPKRERFVARRGGSDDYDLD